MCCRLITGLSCKSVSYYCPLQHVMGISCTEIACFFSFVLECNNDVDDWVRCIETRSLTGSFCHYQILDDDTC